MSDGSWMVTIVCHAARHGPRDLVTYRRAVTEFGGPQPVVTWNWDYHRAMRGGAFVPEAAGVEGAPRERVDPAKRPSDLSPALPSSRVASDLRQPFDTIRCRGCKKEFQVERNVLHRLLEEQYRHGQSHVGLDRVATLS